MNVKLLTLFAICISAFVYAQTPKVEWTKAIGGLGNERANSITTDRKGNVILVGRFQSPTMKIDQIVLTKSTLDNEDVADIFIIKLDKSGNPLWAVSAGEKGDDHAMSCVTDRNGNIYVVGWFESKTLTFGRITLNNKTEKGCDMFLAKFSSTGECIWARNAGGEGDNGNYSTIVLDSKNNVIVGGIAGNVMDFGNGIRLTNQKSGMYVAKYSNSGDLLWVKGSKRGECQGVSVDKNNNVFAGGYFTDTTSFDDLTLVSNGESDAYVVKYNSEGEALWAKNFGGEGGEIASCELDPSGNIYLAGLFFGKTIYTEKGTLTNKGEMNAFIAKFDNSGNLIWTKSAGGNNGDGPATGTREFYIDKNGNAYCTGSNWSEFTFAGQTIKTVAGSEDIFLLKYDKVGNESWGVDYGGTGRNAGRGITTDNQGTIFLTGSFDEKALKIEGQTLLNVGDADIFIVKFRMNK